MIIKIWRYEARAEGVVGGGVKQRLGFDTAFSSGHYIFGLEITPDQLAVLDQVKPIGDYVARESEDPKRILGRYAYNLAADTAEEQVKEIALQAGRAGLDHFWHVVVSHRPGEEVTDEDREFIRQTVSRVLGVKECPAIWSTHGDEPHDHDHGLIVSFLAEEDRVVPFGDHWWKEKGQIAMAICEHRLGLDPEPNRRYVADESGVYHFLTDTRVADAEGNLVLDRKALRTLQRDHQDWTKTNDAPTGLEPGDEWPLERAAEELAAPRIRNAKSWAALHESLARVGFRYVTVGNTASLEAVDVQPECEGQKRHARIAAGAAYSNAALGKLSKRIGTYQPPATDLRVRRFIMPRYNRTDAEKRALEHDRLQEKEEFDELLQHLEKDNSDRYRRLRDQEQGASVNARRKKRKAEHDKEVAAAKKLKRHVGRKSAARSKVRPTTAASEGDGFAMIWGPPAGRADSEVKKKEKAALRKRYSAEERSGERLYYRGAELAFIERLRTIEIVSRKRRVRIDALRLARRRFMRIRIAANQHVREGLARIAAELGIKLQEAKLVNIGAFHQAAVETGRRASIVEKSERWAQSANRRADLRDDSARDRRRRRHSATTFPLGKLEQLQNLNEMAVADAKYRKIPNPEPAAASRTLDHVDRNSLHLASSRSSLEGIRFLDDPALVAAFAKKPQHMVLPEVQLRLQAIEAIQIEERRWIAAALLTGRVTLNDGSLVAKDETDEWAERFWAAQKGDPSFRRLLAISHLRPDRFAFDLDERPDAKAWLKARARDPELGRSIADAIHLASEKHGRGLADGAVKAAGEKRGAINYTTMLNEAADSYRERVFATMEFRHAAALRKSPGKFELTYRNEIRRRPDESQKQFMTRVEIAERSERHGRFRS